MSNPLTAAQAPLGALQNGARVHLVGVAGAGMNALAALLLARGFRLSGSDQQTSSQVRRLVSQGLAFHLGHDAALVAGVDLVVISAAVRESNLELAAARAACIPVVKRAAALGWLLADSRTIAVAGTHGKTTTSAMLAVILRHAGCNPTFVIGGEVLDLNASAAIGEGAWAVVEADEYDRSFLQLAPEIAVITNVEPDHLEYYGSAAAMVAAFHDFLARLRPGGVLVRNLDDPFLRALPAGDDWRAVDCALAAPAPWRAEQIVEHAAGSSFTLACPQGRYSVRLLLSGRHNIANAVQAIAAAVLAGVPITAAVEALAAFHGTGRRFQVVGQVGGVVVIDDYAHHPTELRATLAAARARYAGRRLVAIFQPHTYSRTRLLFDDFAAAFGAADLLVLTAIYAARETDTLGIDAAQLAAAIARQPGAPELLLLPDLAAIPALLAPRLRAGDVVLTLGAGSITELGPRLLALLEEGHGPQV